jgi:hypothetical protein
MIKRSQLTFLARQAGAPLAKRDSRTIGQICHGTKPAPAPGWVLRKRNTYPRGYEFLLVMRGHVCTPDRYEVLTGKSARYAELCAALLTGYKLAVDPAGLIIVTGEKALD